jgi:HEAT repeat protein
MNENDNQQNDITIDVAINILKEKSQASSARLDALLVIVDKFESDFFPLFEDILQDPDENSDVRSAVALALGKISGERPFNILKSHCRDTDTIVRNYVIQALGMTHKEEAAPLLINALQDQSNTVFASASHALGELGYKAEPYLIDLLSSGADDARCVAAWQLGELQSEDSVHALVETIRREKNVSVIALCIWALGEIGLRSDEVLEILGEARKKPEPDVRLRAETAMKKIVSSCN